MTRDEWLQLISYVAANPEKGAIISNTGGVRKLRFAMDGKGKSGSYRIIYYFYTDDFPIYMFEIYTKNQKANISNAEKNELKKIINQIKTEFRKKIKD